MAVSLRGAIELHLSRHLSSKVGEKSTFAEIALRQRQYAELRDKMHSKRPPKRLHALLGPWGGNGIDPREELNSLDKKSCYRPRPDAKFG
mmetsp:Transcript_10245/g.28747  ORF Transcript_10245/g.28747 Transcript_10245/m.28747 type:complete len:90 (+) Transcript_10245:485-754(+)